MKQKNFLKIAFCFFLISGISYGQLSVTSTNTDFTISFDATLAGVNNGVITGGGFEPTPAIGNFDSDAWRVTGMSDGASTFGGTHTLGDFARNSSTGGVTTGGIYAFEVITGNHAFGIQPGGSDFTPGTITLKVTNNTGITATSIALSYVVWVLNDQGRSNSFNFQYSTDDMTYTPISALNLTSTAGADGSPVWVSNLKTTTISNLNLLVGETIYLQWLSGDITGSGSRDEFALDDIVVNMAAAISSTTWTGNVDTNWSTAGNWSDGIPTVSKNAIIPDVANAPIINGSTNASVNDLTINEPDGLTINSGGTLIVNGTSTGNVTYKRTLGFDADPAKGWYLVSSPVANVNMTSMIANNSFAIGSTNNLITNIGFAPYDDAQTLANQKWRYFDTNSSIALVNGAGYSAKVKSDNVTISFTGQINNANVTPTVSTAGNGFNLLGNPYTSHLDISSFINDNTTNLEGTIWLWNQAANGGLGNYETYPTQLPSLTHLAPAQGFFVKAKIDNATIIFDITKQAASGGIFQKSSNTLVKLMMNDGSIERYAKVYYVAEATTGFDNGYDGETFGGIPNSFEVFTHLVANSEGKKYQVQSLPNSDFENMVIPVGVTAAKEKEITFSLEAQNIPTGINVYLEDKITNTVTLLSEANATYKVTLSESLDGIGRFYLHTKASGVLSTETIALDYVSIYSVNSSTLRVAGLSEGKANLKIFSILGKQVFETSFNATGVKDMQLPKVASGIYVVQLTTEKGTLNKKITLE